MIYFSLCQTCQFLLGQIRYFTIFYSINNHDNSEQKMDNDLQCSQDLQNKCEENNTPDAWHLAPKVHYHDYSTLLCLDIIELLPFHYQWLVLKQRDVRSKDWNSQELVKRCVISLLLAVPELMSMEFFCTDLNHTVWVSYFLFRL